MSNLQDINADAGRKSHPSIFIEGLSSGRVATLPVPQRRELKRLAITLMNCPGVYDEDHAYDEQILLAMEAIQRYADTAGNGTAVKDSEASND